MTANIGLSDLVRMEKLEFSLIKSPSFLQSMFPDIPTSRRSA